MRPDPYLLLNLKENFYQKMLYSSFAVSIIFSTVGSYVDVPTFEIFLTSSTQPALALAKGGVGGRGKEGLVVGNHYGLCEAIRTVRGKSDA